MSDQYEYICQNPECPIHDVVTTSPFLYPDDPPVICGSCSQPTMTTDGIAHPYTAPLSLDERVTELEEFNDQLVTALMTVLDTTNDVTADSLRSLLRSDQSGVQNTS